MRIQLFLMMMAIGVHANAQIATVGSALPKWEAGFLDLHHINTGRGDAAYYVFPDGTSMLLDAGEMDPTVSRTRSKRNTPIHPNGSKLPFQWITEYIRSVAPEAINACLPAPAGRIAPQKPPIRPSSRGSRCAVCRSITSPNLFCSDGTHAIAAFLFSLLRLRNNVGIELR